jgi:Flp pilus assembly protein TadD
MNRWHGGLVAGVFGLVLGGALQAAPPANMPAVAAGDLTPAQSAQLSLDLAATMERMEKYNDAIAQYERALAFDARNHQALRRLAVLYSKTGQFERADVYFQKAASVEPRNANVFNDWGRSYYLRGNWQAAEKKFDQALQIEPRHRLATNNLALALGQEKRYTEAFQIFRNGGLSEAQCHCNIAYILSSQGRVDEARNACNFARQLDPNCVKAEELLTQLGQPEHAEIQKASYQQPTACPDGTCPAPTSMVKPAATTCPATTTCPAVTTCPCPACAVQPATVQPATVEPAVTPPATPQPVYQSPDGKKWFVK